MEDEEQSREWNSLMEVKAKSRILAVRGLAGSGLPGRVPRLSASASASASPQ